ncbi:GNAT family N-acetyltransferase [Roseivirga sp.]|uniref:GNAT family N-acetyltransferase n=1 Tax=Roseivirga sp. TaxID=1964215 RepID=UPI003B8E304F
MDYDVVEGSIQEALIVLKDLPEFDKLKAAEYYINKIGHKPNLVLLAKQDEQIIGCKVGYDRFDDGSFYSSLGGVLPRCRKLGIAKKLADCQEQWARKKGYQSIKFKTLNRHKSMIIFAIKNGFEIYNIKPKDELENYRIEMIKYLP